jgi:CheY-like chemotaxis protein
MAELISHPGARAAVAAEQRRDTPGVEPGAIGSAPLVIVVDDDEAVRLSICELLESVGIDATGFGSTRELLDTKLPDRSGCLVLDVRMPGNLSGLDLAAAARRHRRCTSRSSS